MKKLHRPDLFGWSAFQSHLDIDFNSVLWVRPSGNVVFDPLPLSEHDAQHLKTLGGVAHICISNSRHLRGADALLGTYDAELLGPSAERATFPLRCTRWLGEGDEPFAGLRTFALAGSKTPGELAFVLDETTLITGDLVRSHRAGQLQLLRPEQGRSDDTAAYAALARLAAISTISAVLVGDGFSEYRHGHQLLTELRDAT